MEIKKTNASLLFSFLFIFFGIATHAGSPLKMEGKVYDAQTKASLENVTIQNISSGKIFRTDSTGLFNLEVQKGELIEFQKMGYKIARVKIPVYDQKLPYYSIAMSFGALELQDVEIRGKNYKVDSIIDRETYKWALDHYKLEGIDIIQHPFDALSKRNRQIWAFQKHFDYFEKQKYIDYVFNNKLINKLVPIDSNSIEEYKRQYRPSYQQIKAWTEYDFFEYIKLTGQEYLRRKARRTQR